MCFFSSPGTGVPGSQSTSTYRPKPSFGLSSFGGLADSPHADTVSNNTIVRVSITNARFIDLLTGSLPEAHCHATS